MSKTSTPGERVATRFAAAVLDEKMKVLLLKLRKGADASLSLGQLFKVLALLGGWNVQEHVGCVPLHFEGHDYLLSNGDEAVARAAYAKLKAAEVTHLPAEAKLGHIYVMNLSPFESKPRFSGVSQIHHGAKYLLWAGLPGYKITSPQGQVFDLLPSRHDVSSGLSMEERDSGLPVLDVKVLKKRLRLYDLFPWLKKETTYLNQINELLGMEPHGPSVPRSRENTGSCGVCFRNIKLATRGDSKTMVLHGYNRPGHGTIVGRCWGEEHPPYELSKTATEIYLLKWVVPRLAAANAYRKRLNTATEFNANAVNGGQPRIIKQGDPLWDRELNDHKSAADRDVNDATAQVRIYKWLVDKWEVRPLPQEDDLHIDWYMKAWRLRGEPGEDE